MDQVALNTMKPAKEIPFHKTLYILMKKKNIYSDSS